MSQELRNTGRWLHGIVVVGMALFFPLAALLSLLGN